MGGDGTIIEKLTGAPEEPTLPSLLPPTPFPPITTPFSVQKRVINRNV